MNRLRQTPGWRYLITEPGTWLALCFLRPVAFRERTEAMSLQQRLKLMLRLGLLILLIEYLPALLIRSILCIVDVNIYPGYFSTNFSLLDPGIISFWFDATWVIVVNCIAGGIFGAFFTLRTGIAVAVALGFSTGINNGVSGYTVVSIIFGLSCGLAIGLAFNSVGAIKLDGLTNVTLGSVSGVLVGLIVGTLIGSYCGFWGGVLMAMLGGPALQNSNLGSAAGFFVGGVLSCTSIFLVGAVIRKFARHYLETINLSIRIGIVVAGALGASIGTTSGDLGLLLGSGGLYMGMFQGTTQGFIVGAAFLLVYLLSYYRLPLFPVNALSMMQTYYFCRYNPEQVFQYLHQSSLYYDECTFLHLPRLERTLRIAAEQDVQQALNEIDFILTERQQQGWAALTISYELALQDLSQRTRLRDIGTASQEIAKFVPLKVRNSRPAIALLFRELEDASGEAANYWNLHNRNYDDKRQTYEVLQRMLTCLNRIEHTTAFREQRLNQQLQAIVKQWQILAKQVQETLNISPESLSQITNPYSVGPALLPQQDLPNPVFVGRDDVVRRLGTALQRVPHPTFCLVGERRMGKSSILLQLPVLLGTSYLPIFCDLQSPGITASIITFFDTIARGISEQLEKKYLAVPTWERTVLEEAQRTNEAQVYTLFDAWLKQIEQLLEQQNLIVLLMLDEFEMLEDAHRRGFLDLDLLLGWIRNVSLYQSRVALLFCGIHTIAALGTKWMGYFVNVEQIKISFLPTMDAHRLIQRAVSPHAATPVFNRQVSEEILQLTRGHPFLLQAVCSKVVDTLNDQGRERAEQQDIDNAVEEIFDTWSNYFHDLWRRCSEVQKSCLLVIHTQGKASLGQIAQSTGMTPASIHLALEQLQQRDLIGLARGQSAYDLTIPIFSDWINRNSQWLQGGLSPEPEI
jgi:hypothetical protein